MAKDELRTGKLDIVSAPELFYELFLYRETGQLSLVQGDRRLYFFFQKGSTVFARAAIDGVDFASFLIQSGMATRQQFSFPDKPFTKINARDLIIRNMMSNDEAIWWQKIYIRDLALKAFAWTTGYYKFQTETPILDYAVTPMDTWQLIEGSLRQINDLPLIIQLLGPLESPPSIRQKTMESMNFLPLKIGSTEGYILSRIDGKASLKDIITMSGPNKLESCKFLLLAKIVKLIKIGLVDTTQEDEFLALPFQLSKSEMSKIKLTTEELKILTHEEQQRHEEEQRKIALDAQTSYMRDGKYVDESQEMAGALNIDMLRGGKKEESDVGEDKIIYVIDGEEVDGESELLFGKGKTGERGQEAASSYAARRHKSIDDMWEEWIENKDKLAEDEFKEDDFEKRWAIWNRMEVERKELEEKVWVLQEEMKGLQSDDPSLMRKQVVFNEIVKKLDDINSQKKMQIIYFYRRSTLKNHYELLQIPYDASNEVINEAYYRWEQEFNPEMHKEEQLGQVWDMLKLLHEHFVEAYEILADDKRRQEYNAFLEDREKAMKLSEERRNMIAEKDYGLAEAALGNGDIWRGSEYLRAAISLNSKEPKYYLRLATLLSSYPNWYWESMKNYNQAIKIQPTNPEYYYQIGNLFTKWGRFTLAQKSYELALRFRPDYSDVKRELKRLEVLKAKKLESPIKTPERPTTKTT